MLVPFQVSKQPTVHSMSRVFLFVSVDLLPFHAINNYASSIQAKTKIQIKLQMCTLTLYT